MQVTREIAVLVALRTAQGIFGTGGAAWIPECSAGRTLLSIQFATPSTLCELNCMIPIAFQAARILSRVKVSLCAGITSLKQ